MDYSYKRDAQDIPKPEERRGYRRYATDVPIKFWYSEEIDTWQEGRIIDFSLEGLQLTTSAELLSDSTLLFDLTPLITHPLETALVTGHVVWKSVVRENLYQYGVFFLMAENQYEGILEETDRDRNLVVEMLANLIMAGKAKLIKPAEITQ